MFLPEPLFAGSSCCVVMVAHRFHAKKNPFSPHFCIKSWSTKFQAFAKAFAKPHHFRIAMSLQMLLEQPDLLPGTTQRLVALFVLYDLHKNDPIAQSPFITLFARILNAKGTSQGGLGPCETHFLSLSGPLTLRCLSLLLHVHSPNTYPTIPEYGRFFYPCIIS